MTQWSLINNICDYNPHLGIQLCIGPACTHRPAFEALVSSLTHIRVVWTSVTVAGIWAMLITIVTGVAVCNTAICCTRRSLGCWARAVHKIIIINFGLNFLPTQLPIHYLMAIFLWCTTIICNTNHLIYFSTKINIKACTAHHNCTNLHETHKNN